MTGSVPLKKICMFWIEGHGYCKQVPSHVIHAEPRISTRSHDFQQLPDVRPAAEELDENAVYEEAKLTKRGVKRIARRSGKSMDELEAMRQLLKGQGKLGQKIKYKVVNPDG